MAAWRWALEVCLCLTVSSLGQSIVWPGFVWCACLLDWCGCLLVLYSALLAYPTCSPNISPVFFLNVCLCSGADKSLKNADEKTAFEVAELNEQADVMELLK